MGLLTAIRKLRYPVATDAFNPPLHIKQLADDVDSRLGESVANAAALPSTDNWPNRIMQTLDDDALHFWDGSGWRLLYMPPIIFAGQLSGSATTGPGLLTIAPLQEPVEMWDAGNPSRITIPRSGLWRVSAKVNQSGIAAIDLRTRQNGSTQLEHLRASQPGTTGAPASPGFSTVCPFNAGNYIEFQAYTPSGSVSLFSSGRAVLEWLAPLDTWTSA